MRIACLLLAFLFSLTTASALAQSTNTLNGSLGVGFVSNPCVSTKNLKNAVVNVSSASTTQLVPISGTTKVYVCKVVIIESGATNVTLETGSTANCANSPTALTGPMPLSWVELSGTTPNYISASGQALCIVNSAAIQVSGSIQYVQQP